MSGTVAADPDSKDDAGRAYFDRIERVFIELRGAPLLLAPADWHVARGWFEEGIPAALVERSLREIFARREERGDERPVTLRYAKRSVAAAWRKEQKLRAPAVEPVLPGVSIGARLDELADALPEAYREEWAPRIRAFGASDDPETVEQALEALERDLHAVWTSALGEPEREQLERTADSEVVGLRGRVEEAELQRARERALARSIREGSGLPRLSLFD